MTPYCTECGINLIKKMEKFYGMCIDCIQKEFKKDILKANHSIEEWLYEP